MHQEETIELRQYWQVLWQHKWIVLQAVVVVFMGTMIFTYRQPPVYKAQSKVLINPPPYLYPYTVPGQILSSQGLPYSLDLPYYINYVDSHIGRVMNSLIIFLKWRFFLCQSSKYSLFYIFQALSSDKLFSKIPRIRSSKTRMFAGSFSLITRFVALGYSEIQR